MLAGSSESDVEREIEEGDDEYRQSDGVIISDSDCSVQFPTTSHSKRQNKSKKQHNSTPIEKISGNLKYYCCKFLASA